MGIRVDAWQDKSGKLHLNEADSLKADLLILLREEKPDYSFWTLDHIDSLVEKLPEAIFILNSLTKPRLSKPKDETRDAGILPASVLHLHTVPDNLPCNELEMIPDPVHEKSDPADLRARRQHLINQNTMKGVTKMECAVNADEILWIETVMEKRGISLNAPETN